MSPNAPLSNSVNAPPSKERSALMARVKGKNTLPEMIVRRLLHSAGWRFRLHRKELPGRPDIVLPRLKIAIFVNGCFWHRHPNCRLASTPKTRMDFWQSKFTANVERDERSYAALAALGWRVLIVWECETRDPERLAEWLIRELDGTTSSVIAAA